MPQSEIKMKMSLDGSGVKKTLNRTKASVQNFSKSGIAAIARFGAAFAGIGLIKSIVGLGTSAAETASKFKAVFGPAADEMNAKVQELRKTIPSTTAEMQNALATFAQMAKAFGLNEKAANGFSVEMVKIAGDIASFNDLPIEEAFLKIRSAISGEFEPMKQLGIVINEARLKQEALNLSIWDGTGQMSAAQKALAVQSILIRDMGDANGDAALTADSAANRIKFLKKELFETGTTIGTTALPAILDLTDGLSQMLELAKKAADFVGTNVGEIMFGVTDETIAKRDKAISQYQAEKQAIRELTEAGELYKQGLFEGTLWTKGLSEKLENNKRLIEARTKAILNSANATETANRAETKANNDALRGAKDLASELEKQAKSEKDPARKKALEDRLEAYRALLKEAGKLKGITKELTEVEKLNQQIKKAEILGNTQLVSDLNKQLEKELVISKIIKDTGVTRKEAVKLSYLLNSEKSKEVSAEKIISEEKKKQLSSAGAMFRLMQSKGTKGLAGAITSMETDKLNYLLNKSKQDLAKLKRSPATKGSIHMSRSAAIALAGGLDLSKDIKNIEAELNKRKKFKLGSESARNLQFNPFQQERLSRVTQGEDEATKLLRSISQNLSGINRTTSKLDNSLS